MKRALLLLLTFGTISVAHADIAVTQGAGKTVATTTDNSREFQDVIVSTSYVNNGSGVPTAIGYATGNSSVPVSIVGGTVNIGTLYQPGSTVMATSGTITGSLPAGSAVIGQVIISSASGVNGSTIAVTNAGGVALKVDGSAVTQPVSGTITANQGTAGTQEWAMRVTSTVVNSGTKFLSIELSTGVTVNGSVSVTNLNGQTSSYVVNPTTVTQSGNWSIYDINNPTTTWDTAFPANGQAISGIGPTGLAQAFRTDASSNVMVNVNAGNAISTNFVNITTATLDAAIPNQVQIGGVVGPTGLAQIQRVDVSSNTWVNVWNSTFTVGGNLTDNNVASAGNRVGVLDGIIQTSYRNGTAGTQGRDSAASYGTDGLLWSASLPSLRPASFVVSTNTITVAANPTDVFSLCGNASNTLLLYSMRVSCTQTTAGNVPITLFKRSTADVGVWSTMTVTAMDSTMNVGISTGVFFLANPTVGTAVGQIDNYNLGCMATGTATPNDIYISPADWRMKPIVLRGTAQCVAVNFNGTAISGGKASVTYNYIETATISP